MLIKVELRREEAKRGKDFSVNVKGGFGFADQLLG